MPDLLAAIDPGLAWSTYLNMGLMVLVGACLQGVSGLGFAMFCSPIAALWFPVLVPGPLLALSCPLALLSFMRERKTVDWSTASLAVCGRLLGTAVAMLCLLALSGKTLSIFFALLILSGVALSVRGWSLRVTPVTAILAGVASGLMGTITSAGAPPLAIAMQSMPAQRLRPTLGLVFFGGASISLAALAYVGRMSHAHLQLSLALAPWMLIGFFLSAQLRQFSALRSLKPILLSLAAVSAVLVLVQALFPSQ